MTEVIYFDTSALAKWYLNEDNSDEVEQYLQERGPVAISELTVVEMRSLLARRRREREIDSKMEDRLFGAFKEDIRQGHLSCRLFSEGMMEGAVNIISILPDTPLRALDALHLAIAKDLRAHVVATADRVMAEGAGAMGFSVMNFARPRRK